MGTCAGEDHPRTVPSAKAPKVAAEGNIFSCKETGDEVQIYSPAKAAMYCFVTLPPSEVMAASTRVREWYV
jgi:hypothetical protein